MRLAMMQSYFFPYIGYFQLIASVDRMILYENLNHIRHGWVHRNRIRIKGRDAVYCSVPLLHASSSVKIRDLLVDPAQRWPGKFLNLLAFNYKKARFFDEVYPVIEEAVSRETARLARRGHGVRVYSMRHYGALDPEYRGMRVVGVPSIPLAACEKVSASIASVLHASMSSWADILHLHSVGPGFMGWLPRLRRKPAVVQFHGIEWRRARWSRFGSAVLKSLERATVRCNRRFTAVSETQCAYLRDTYGIEARCIPGGADVKTAPEPRELLALGLEPRRYALFASRLVREKGAHYLVEAFRRLDTTDRLVIAGDVPGAAAYRDELRRLAGDDSRIVWPGFVQGRLLEELVGHARVYVQPSDLEGLSLALLEAMGYGTCCLASDIPENVEALGDAGATFRRGDAGDLAAKLRTLMGDPAAAAAYGARAVARIREHFSWDRVADAFEGFYREIARPVSS